MEHYSKTFEGIEVLFVDEEITCPFCETHGVEEREYEFVCLCCGESWKYLTLEG